MQMQTISSADCSNVWDSHLPIGNAANFVGYR